MILKGLVGFENNFNGIYLVFTPSFLSQNWCQISVRIFCVLPGTRNLQFLVCQLLYSSFFLLRTFFSWPLKHTAWPFWPLKIQKDTSTIFQLPSHFFATVLTILLYIHFQRFCSEYLGFKN